MATCHAWDLFAAPVASVATVQAKLKKGWALRPLSMPYGAAGGVAEISHALTGPDGELLRVTARTLEQLPGVTVGEQLAIDLRVWALNVPFAEKNQARAAGACWMPHLKRWGAHPLRTADVAQWLSDPPEPVSIHPE